MHVQTAAHKSPGVPRAACSTEDFSFAQKPTEDYGVDKSKLQARIQVTSQWPMVQEARYRYIEARPPIANALGQWKR